MARLGATNKSTFTPKCSFRFIDPTDSNGSGRTGTLISILQLYQDAAEDKRIDLFATVNKLRTFRPGMVQTPVSLLLIPDRKSEDRRSKMKLHLFSNLARVSTDWLTKFSASFTRRTIWTWMRLVSQTLVPNWSGSVSTLLNRFTFKIWPARTKRDKPNRLRN